ncbi:MAG: alpha/beta fold hydrolase [Pseudomonadota bacterium]
MRQLFLALMVCPAMAVAEPVQIAGPDGPLEAELIHPAGAEHVVVVIPGSGPIDRDGNAPAIGLSTDVYRLLAEAMARQGIASLRIDKRGLHGSAAAIADPNDVTIDAYAQDARRWVARASGIARCVWLAGHSEGGLVSLVAAQDPPDSLCGLILLATPGRPVGQLMIEQFVANPANAPFMPDLRAVIADLEAGRTRAPETLPEVLQPLFTAGLQRYMIDLFSHDPAQIARAWRGPALIVHGEADIQVRETDARTLAAALPQASRLDLPAGTHTLKAKVAGRPFATYSDPALPLHPDLVPGIVQFIDASGAAE